MTHYFEIKLLPDPEFSQTVLMNALYMKLHRILVQFKCNDIGISFPKYNAEKIKKADGVDEQKTGLGDYIRFHSDRERLHVLLNSDWLKGMCDHLKISQLYEVPFCDKYVVFSRVQVKSNVERIRRRQMKRHNLSYEEACMKVSDSIVKKLSLPFVTVTSSSTGQKFRLFIKKEILELPVSGSFNCYGLSNGATVPIF